MVVSKKEPIIWHAHEYTHREKSSDWYWAVSITSFSIATAAILFNNVLFAVLIVLAFFILMMYSKRKPNLLEIKLDERGIIWGHTHHLFNGIDSFWVEDRFGNPRLIIKAKNKVVRYIVMPIIDVPADEVRDHLKRHLKEVEHHEPIAKQLMEYLGF
ncbi:MAG: hypothetical protein NUV54_01370 [Candidatus Taylorbacteria bacterium]|nr:hypothetical protein [Candidatus Taylorbacteria bacterium]